MTVHASGAGRSVSDGRVRLITKVAHMYYEQGIRQADIADALHISQTKVSRLLKRASEIGIVRTVVIATQGVHLALEQALESRYGLQEAVVVDVDGDESEIIAGIGSAGAAYLESTLAGGERIGISPWSQTLLSVVDRLRPLRVTGADRVVQLLGGVGERAVQAKANRLLSHLAELIGAEPTYVQAPGLVGTADIRQSLITDAAMQSVAEEWRNLTMALVGIGSVQPSPLLRDSGNAIDPADQDQLIAAHAVGDVCQRFFDSTGELIHSDLNSRVVGIDPEVFRTIPRRIGMAGGERKHAAIRAAITGGWVNVIITDVTTANALLNENPPTAP
ncbi:sugar-binding transcriptional regulator [Nonomuraea aridisoli]|uniref:DNA-binding transcriptional regulator n=1 Tax=Nonomuraea aridisoli TaxID=2070368 RepID=A0A2W2FW69_9ACTN|nr:sugar-binding transcriptional regulator [Nonomuraea aridisoli]PZG19104.1 DNA-binding transcriptional regulator [Nonomuraea aridisoli]